MGITDAVWSENPIKRNSGKREIDAVQSIEGRYTDWAHLSKARGLPLLVPESAWNFFGEKHVLNLGGSKWAGGGGGGGGGGGYGGIRGNRVGSGGMR